MIRDVLQSIPGISAFPIIGLIIFLAVFIAVAIWALFYSDKKHRRHMKWLPIEDQKSSSSVGE
jgi:hypothetical protein